MTSRGSRNTRQNARGHTFNRCFSAVFCNLTVLGLATLCIGAGTGCDRIGERPDEGYRSRVAAWQDRSGDSTATSFSAPGHPVGTIDAPAYADLRHVRIVYDGSCLDVTLRMGGPIPERIADWLWVEVEPRVLVSPDRAMAVGVVGGSYPSDPEVKLGHASLVTGDYVERVGRFVAKRVGEVTMRRLGAEVHLNIPLAQVDHRYAEGFRALGNSLRGDLEPSACGVRVFYVPRHAPTGPNWFVEPCDELDVPRTGSILTTALPTHPQLVEP
ncbi:MAG: hypothetical protein HRF45_12885 [Fimbriimonadia bacterium]